MLEQVDAKILGKALLKVKAETLVDAVSDTLAELEPKTLSKHWPL